MNDLVKKVEAELEQVKKDLADFQESGDCSYKLVILEEPQACEASEEIITEDSKAFEIDYVEEIYVGYDYMEFWLRQKLGNTQLRLEMAKEL